MAVMHAEILSLFTCPEQPLEPLWTYSTKMVWDPLQTSNRNVRKKILISPGLSNDLLCCLMALKTKMEHETPSMAVHGMGGRGWD